MSGLAEQADTIESAAEQLDLAVAHLRRAADHFRGGAVPRACAHTVAGEGHLVNARRLLDDVSTTHASRSAAD